MTDNELIEAVATKVMRWQIAYSDDYPEWRDENGEYVAGLDYFDPLMSDADMDMVLRELRGLGMHQCIVNLNKSDYGNWGVVGNIDSRVIVEKVGDLDSMVHSIKRAILLAALEAIHD